MRLAGIAGSAIAARFVRRRFSKGRVTAPVRGSGRTPVRRLLSTAFRTRFRRLGARTKTIQRGSRETFADMEKDIRRSKALIPMGPRLRPSGAKILGRVVYQQTKTGNISNAEGKQGYGDIFSFYDSSQFVAQTAPEMPLFRLNPLSNWGTATDGVIYPNAPVGAGGNTFATRPNSRILLAGCRVDLQLCNFSPIPSTVTLYITTPKTNLNTNPFGDWGDMLLKEDSVAGAAAYSATGAGTFGGALQVDYGQAPERLKAWRSMHRVLRRYTIELNGGSTHKYQLFFRYNRMVDQEYIQECQDKSTFNVKNLTVNFSLVSRPGPVDAAANSLITTGISKIGYIATIQHYLQFPEMTPNIQVIAPNVPSDPLALTAGHEETIVNVVDAAAKLLAANIA